MRSSDTINNVVIDIGGDSTLKGFTVVDINALINNIRPLIDTNVVSIINEMPF